MPAPVSWTFNEIQLRKKIADAFNGDPDATYAKITVFTEELRSTYPDYSRYRFYHVLVGSTPTTDMDLFDFPNNEVRLFVESL